MAVYRHVKNPVLRRVLLIADGRTPFEFVLMLALLLSAIQGLLGLNNPNSVSSRILATLSQGYVTLWHSSIILASSTVLVAVMLNSPLSLKVERAGLVFMSCLIIPYAIGTYVILGVRQVGAGGILILFLGLACLARVLQIRYDLIAHTLLAKEFKQVQREAYGDEE